MKVLKRTGLLFLFLLSISILSAQEIQYVNMSAPSKWKQSVDGVTRIQVHWRNMSPDTYQERQWVREAIEDTWMKYAKIEFYGWQQYNNNRQGIIIDINDYVVPRSLIGTNVNGTEGFNDKSEGLWINGGMLLNFKFLGPFKGYPGFSHEENIKSIAVHEFGHALGIVHEQDRPNCGCAQHPNHPDQVNLGGEYYGTPCDLHSVMNYCNPVYNNRGKLSKYDIMGIQAAYGVRFNTQSSTKRVSISNALGTGQLWENLDLTIGGVRLFFNVNSFNLKEVKEITVNTSGFLNYTVNSQTMFTNNVLYYGSGVGQIYIDKNKSYRITISLEEYTSANTFRIKLNAVDIEKEQLTFFKQEAINLNTALTPKNLSDIKPTGLLKLYATPNEKFYIYWDGTIKVYNTDTKAFFVCGKKLAPTYQAWNGKIWAWAFNRPIGNNKTEYYTVSTTGEVWAMAQNGTFLQYGYVTNPDF